MPRSRSRKSQKVGGSCSYVNQTGRRAGARKGSRKVRRSQRAGGCGYTGEPRRAGAKRSQRGGNGCHEGHLKVRSTRRNRKSRTSNRKRVVVDCGDATCGRKRL